MLNWQHWRYHKKLTNKFPILPVATIRCDNAREYVNGDFKSYCEAAGINIDPGSPYTPELNGIAEQKNRTIIEKVRALLSDGGGVVIKFWPFTAKMAEYILNRSPSKSNPEFLSPFQQVFGEPPDLSKMHPFGCIVMVHKPVQTRTQISTAKKETGLAKIGPVSEIGVLFRFTDTGYIMYILSTESTKISSDVKFFDDISYSEYQNVDIFQEQLNRLSAANSQEEDAEPEQHPAHELDDHSYAPTSVAMGPAAFLTYLKAKKNSNPTSLSEAIPGS